MKKHDGSLPDPPYDICVSHETFITKEDTLPEKNKVPLSCIPNLYFAKAPII